MSLELTCLAEGGPKGLLPDFVTGAAEPAGLDYDEPQGDEGPGLAAEPLDGLLDLDRVVWDLEYREAVMRRLKRDK